MFVFDEDDEIDENADADNDDRAMDEGVLEEKKAKPPFECDNCGSNFIEQPCGYRKQPVKANTEIKKPAKPMWMPARNGCGVRKEVCHLCGMSCMLIAVMIEWFRQHVEEAQTTTASATTSPKQTAEEETVQQE